MSRRAASAPVFPPAKPLSMLWLIGAGCLTGLVVLFAVAGADSALVLLPLMVTLLILIPWLLACAGFGLIVLRAMRLGCAKLLHGVIAIALGLGIISLLTLILGCAGFLNRISAAAMIAVGCVIAVAHLRRSAGGLREKLTRPAHWHWLLLVLAPLLSITLSCAMLPPGILWGDEPNGYDVTEYHLQVPREWYETHRIIPLHHNVFSYFPFNVEMHYLLAMQLMGGPWKGMYLAQLMHVSFIVLTVLAVYAVLSERSTRSAVIGCTIAASTPWLALLAPVAYNEGGLLLFGTLSIGLTLRALRGTQSTRWMLLAGAFAGFACGCKLTAVPMVLIPLPVLFILSRWLPVPLPPGEGRGEGASASRSASTKERPLTLTLPPRDLPAHRRERAPEALLAFCIAAAITFSPWLIRNTVWTHNPVFPELTSVFGKAHFSDTQVDRWKRANHEPRPDQQNLAGRSRALRDQVVGDARYLGFTFQSGWFVPSLLVLLALIAACIRVNRESFLLLVLLLLNGAFWLFFTHLQSRFFVLSIPICALLIGRAEAPGFQLTSAAMALLLAILGTFYVTWKVAAVEHRMSEFQIRLFQLAGLPSLRNFSRLPESDDGKIVELVGDAQAFFYDVPMSRLYYRTVFDVDVKPSQSAEQGWRDGWPTDAPNVLVIRDEQELERFRQTYYGIP